MRAGEDDSASAIREPFDIAGAEGTSDYTANALLTLEEQPVSVEGEQQDEWNYLIFKSIRIQVRLQERICDSFSLPTALFHQVH